ncbi:MAG: hypothetical protein MZW92_38515 [Comamonadaceae bacterium]|nr:hypothetical protein [Comamonadaceae bacterium]
MSGFEVCQHLRADPNLKGTPIIIITAMADPDLKTKDEAGFNLAIPKPFNPTQIILLIKKALGEDRGPRGGDAKPGAGARGSACGSVMRGGG